MFTWGFIGLMSIINYS